MKVDFSVVIPLYNKEREIADTLRSVLRQRYAPLEVIVVDDGSTDRGAQIAEELAAGYLSQCAAQTQEAQSGDARLRTNQPHTAQPIDIKIISQLNEGVSSARNRGIEEATGKYIAFLDADDEWNPEYLQEVAALIGKYPGAGMYCAGFNVRRSSGVFPNDTATPEGIVDNYFKTALRHGITHTSGVTIPRGVLAVIGGFPDGMKLGEDMYMWTKVASAYPVGYTPKKLYTFDLTAQNRSPHRFKMEQTKYSFREFYDPAPENYWRNEYIARTEIGRGTLFSVSGYTREAREIAKFYSYTRTYCRGLRRLRLLCSLPVSWRAGLNDLYKRLAWTMARRGRFE